MVQHCEVEAASKAEAIRMVKAGQFDVDRSDSNALNGTRRKFTAERLD